MTPNSPDNIAAYLLDVAKDVATLVDDRPMVIARFREQLRAYQDAWKQWLSAEQAGRRKWTPAIGKPECPLAVFSRMYNNPYDAGKETKQLIGYYSLLAFLHDRELPCLEKINNSIVTSRQIIRETLSAPRNALDGRLETPGSSGPDLREGYLFDQCLNAVEIDLRDFLGDRDPEDEQPPVEPEESIKDMPDADLFQHLARTFETDSLLAMQKEKTWRGIDRSLGSLFKEAIRRLKTKGKKNTGVQEYRYQNLLHYARGMQTRKGRRPSDTCFWGKVLEYGSELADAFGELALEATRDAENQGWARPTSEDRITRLIQKLEELVRRKGHYQSRYPDVSSAETPDPRGDGYWKEHVQPWIEDIELELVGTMGDSLPALWPYRHPDRPDWNETIDIIKRQRIPDKMAEVIQGFRILKSAIVTSTAHMCDEKSEGAPRQQKVEEEVSQAEQTSANTSAHVTLNIQNSNVTMGNIHQTQDAGTGNRSSLGGQTPDSLKNKRNIKTGILVAIPVIAALLGILEKVFGWIGAIWRFLTAQQG
jgi:hypothetical protein